ncbi:MAG: hypothetical protein JEY96_19870 [Bacteroidales bacterium]|nr:hypothetical protein [Bacteroidales bacterium]
MSFNKRLNKNIKAVLGDKKNATNDAMRGVMVVFPFVLIYTLIEPIFLLFRNKKQHDKEQEA